MTRAPVKVTEDDRDDRLEAALDETFTRLVTEGDERLSRTWPQLLSTGTVAGLEVAFGVLALLAVEAVTGSPLLGGLAFSVGFLALLMGRSELFTESFFVPVIAVASGHRSLRDLVRLWTATLVMNLAGGWLITWLLMLAYPSLHETAVETAAYFMEAGQNAQTFALAVLAGAAITLMTRMQHGTESMAGKIVAAVVGAFVIAGLQMHHSVLDSLLAFAAFHTGEATFSYVDWLRFLVWALMGNVVGGVGLVTVLRLVRSGPRLRQERHREGVDRQGSQR